VTFPSTSLTTIGDNVFNFCTEIVTVTLLGPIDTHNLDTVIVDVPTAQVVTYYVPTTVVATTLRNMDWVKGIDVIIALDMIHTGGGFGDPYIYPVLGLPHKLPNVSDCYRLYQDKNVVVNARVSMASDAIQREIAEVGQEYAIDRIVAEHAYFFSHVYIAHRTKPNNFVEIALEDRKTSAEGSYFQLNSPILNGEVGHNAILASELNTHVSISVQWDLYTRLCVSFSRHPQVRNGISIHGPTITNGTGLLIRNYRPKLCRVNRLDDIAGLTFPSTRRLTTKRGLGGNHEHRVKVCSRRL
jgi:hypothetical protein